MKIAKIVTTSVLTTDGKELKDGDRIIYTDNLGNCCIGTYKGLGEKATLIVASELDHKAERKLKASSIKEIYKVANIRIDSEAMLNAD